MQRKFRPTLASRFGAPAATPTERHGRRRQLELGDRMRLIEVLQVLDRNFVPAEAKIHLASHNGWADPLDEYRAGTFDRWQSSQTRQNFGRPYVISLIQMPAPSNWLFAGLYSADGCSPDGDGFVYRLSARPS